MEVNITGLDDILQKLNNLPLEEEDENRALNKAANVIKKAVIEEAPEDDGTLKKEIKVKRAKDGEAKVHSGKAYHAHILEGGRSGGQKYTLKNGRHQLVKWGPMAPNPFFTRSFERSKRDAQLTMANEVKKVLKL